MAPFKIKSEPQRPERYKEEYVTSSSRDGNFRKAPVRYDYVYIGTVGDLLNWCERNGVDPEKAEVEHEHGYYDSVDLYVCGYREEPLDDYEKRLEAWRKKHAAWEQWYKDNEDKIKDELARRAALEKTQKRESDEKRAAQLERELAQIQKRLKRKAT